MAVPVLFLQPWNNLNYQNYISTRHCCFRCLVYNSVLFWQGLNNLNDCSLEQSTTSYAEVFIQLLVKVIDNSRTPFAVLDSYEHYARLKTSNSSNTKISTFQGTAASLLVHTRWDLTLEVFPNCKTPLIASILYKNKRSDVGK